MGLVNNWYGMVEIVGSELSSSQLEAASLCLLLSSIRRQPCNSYSLRYTKLTLSERTPSRTFSLLISRQLCLANPDALRLACKRCFRVDEYASGEQLSEFELLSLKCRPPIQSTRQEDVTNKMKNRILTSGFLIDAYHASIIAHCSD